MPVICKKNVVISKMYPIKSKVYGDMMNEMNHIIENILQLWNICFFSLSEMS